MSGAVFSAGAAVRGLRRCVRARSAQRQTDVYLQWMLDDLGSPTMERRRLPTEDHSVQLYEHDAEIVLSIADFYEAGLAAGDPVVLVATAAHRQAVEAVLTARGHDLATARYGALDAAETLDRFLVDGSVDSDFFDATVGQMVRALVAEGRPVRIYGEMVGILWGAGDVAGAMRLETLWNELRRQVPFALHCGYGLAARDDRAGLEALCRLHGAMVNASQDDADAEGLLHVTRAG